MGERWQFPQIDLLRLFIRCDRCHRMEVSGLACIEGNEALCIDCYHAKYLTGSSEEDTLDATVRPP